MTFQKLTVTIISRSSWDDLLISNDPVNNHASILLYLKNTRRIQKESSSDLETSSGHDRGWQSAGQPLDRRSYNSHPTEDISTYLLKNSTKLHHPPHHTYLG